MAKTEKGHGYGINVKNRCRRKGHVLHFQTTENVATLGCQVSKKFI